MKQHAIPHNILDIEFKLFGKLTLKQAGFIAIGGISGGLFLLLRANGAVPDLLAWPAFIILSGAGLFLGLVPINEQTADKIIGYYFTAISKPTRRVWKNSQFKQRLDTIAEEKGLHLTQGKMGHNNQKDSNQTSNFIGSGPSMPSTQQFGTQNTINELDAEEQQKLQQFDKIAAQTATTIPQQTTQVQPQAIIQPQTATPIQQQANAQSQVAQPVQQASAKPQVAQPVQQANAQSQTTTPVQPQAMVQQPSQIQQQKPNPQATTLQAKQIIQQNAPKQTTVKSVNIQKDEQPIPVKQSAPQLTQEHLTISSETAVNHPQSQIQVSKSPNIPFFQFLDGTNHPVPQTLIIIKNSAGTAVQAHQTNPQGAIIPTRPLENGTYVVEVQSNKYTFPSIQYIADGKSMNPIQIRAK